jgi:hypothetical protein
MIIRFLLTIITLCLLLVAPAYGTVLDWSNVSWTPGSLTQTYNLDGDAFDDITITISGDTSALVSGYPSIGTGLQGGLGSADDTLLLRLDFANPSQSITVTVQFHYYYVGATNVSFSLFDVDGDQVGASSNYRFRDHLSELSATGDNGLIVAALTAGTASSTAGSGTNQTVTGHDLANDTGTSSGAGNVSIDYGSNNVNEFSFTFGNTGNILMGDPQEQVIAIHDIKFKSKVPEVGTTLMAVTVCAGLSGLRRLRSWRQTKA